MPEVGDWTMGPKITDDTNSEGAAPTERPAPEGSATRRRILQIALTLMAQRGVKYECGTVNMEELSPSRT